jgi:GAF domain-containing protein
MNKIEKSTRYVELRKEIAATIAGEANLVARLSTIAAILHQGCAHYFWTGFYVVDPERPDELVIGPYQGTLGCLRIPFGRGVCGAAAERRDTIVVPDVHEFPGHIACDPRSRSEIAVPVFDRTGRLIAIFDVDSDEPAMFDETDKAFLEDIMKAAAP